jgi:hypothetical protein
VPLLRRHTNRPNKAAAMMRDAKLEPLIDFPGINQTVALHVYAL